MLEKPDLPDQALITRLKEEYGLPFTQVTFLPWGADANAAVYRAVIEDGAAYFLKLSKRALDGISVELPRFLHAQGITAIIAPLETRSGLIFGSLEDYKMILYPYVEGENGYRRDLTDAQWTGFGAAVKAVHTAQVPPALLAQIPRETYSPRWREMVRGFLEQVKTTTYKEPVAARMADFLQTHWEDVLQILSRADALGEELAARPLEFVLCHADLHPGNLLITSGGDLYIVDWDNPLFAPKEKDLALIGGCGTWKDPKDVLHFYRGYGPSPVDREALAYFRYERIIQDIAAFGEQLLLSVEGTESREQAYAWFTGNFQPGGEIELARAIDD